MSMLLDAPPSHAPAPAAARIPADVRRTLLAVLATALSVTALVAVVKLGAWLPKSLGVVVLAFVLGTLGRTARVPRPAVVAVQAVAALCVVVAMAASTDATWGFVPGPGALEDLGRLWNGGIGELTRLVPPDNPSPGITTVLVLAAAVAAIVVDALAVGYRRPDLAGLFLVVVYAVPAATLPNGWRGAWFLLPALGFLLLAFDGNNDRVRTWGEDTVTDSGSGGRRSTNIGVAVLTLSFAIPAALPSVTGGLFNDSGIGLHIQEPIETLDPLQVMRELLVRPTDDPLFSQTTDSSWPDEAYLHSVTLEVFDGKLWRAGDRDVRRYDGEIPDSVGTGSTVPTVPFQAELTARPQSESDYVPMPRPVITIDIEGNWRLAPSTSDVLSFAGRDQIGAKSWTVSGFDRDPDPKALSGQAPTDNAFLAPYVTLPKLPPAVEAEARRITKGAKSAVEVGRKLQDYFANAKNTTYDLRPAGSGTNAITAFLQSKRGYAEQTAATMAVMARVLGIPSRLAVGFTAGKAEAGGARVIGAHDAHAWPELFLPEVGWTRFEPTPAKAPGSPRPLHWLVPEQKGSAPKPDQEKNNQPQPPQPQPQQPRPEPQPAPSDQPNEVPKDTERNVALLAMLGSLLVLGLLLAPRILRAVITRRRWVRARAAGAGAVFVSRVAWLELRDAAVDLGYAWPRTRTPRRAGQELADKAHLTPGTVAELEEVCRVVEQVRYAPPSGLKVDAFRQRTAVLQVRRELAAAAAWPDRVRALLLPRSLVPMIREAAQHAVSRIGAARPRPAAGRRRARAGSRMRLPTMGVGRR